VLSAAAAAEGSASKGLLNALYRAVSTRSKGLLRPSDQHASIGRGGGITIERVFAAASVLILPAAAGIEFAAASIASR
jgi:hypothetical protein